MKVLVKDGAVFIDSAVVHHTIQNTTDLVVNVDYLTYTGNIESLTSLESNECCTFGLVNICDRIALDRVIVEHMLDARMDLDAEYHVNRSITGPVDLIETNIVGAFTLLEARREYWVTLESDTKFKFRFHHTSTDEMYGDFTHPEEADFMYESTNYFVPSSELSIRWNGREFDIKRPLSLVVPFMAEKAE